jgi:hypothetical protein
MRLEPHRLVFLDETGTTTKMTRLRGCCPKGQRLRCKAPFGHWMTQTFVASLRCDKLTAPFLQQALNMRAMDQGRQGRDQMDAAVMSDVRRERRPSPASWLAYNLGNFAHAGDAGADQDPMGRWIATGALAE